MCLSLTERLPSPATLLLIQNITYCFLATNKQPYQSEIGKALDEAFRPLQSPLNPQQKLPSPCSSAALDAVVG